MNRALFILISLSGASSLMLIDSAIKGSALLLFAAGVVLFLRRDSSATRHMVWLVAIIALLAMPVLSAMLPQWRVLPDWVSVAEVSEENRNGNDAWYGVYEADVAVQTSHASHDSHDFDAADALPVDDALLSLQAVDVPATSTIEPIVTAAIPGAIVPTQPITKTWHHALVSLWFTGFALLMIRLAIARAMLWRTERQSRSCLPGRTSRPRRDQRPDEALVPEKDAGENADFGWLRRVLTRVRFALRRKSRSASGTYLPPQFNASERSIHDAFTAACTTLNIRQHITVLHHPDKTIPVVWGIFRPRLMLPLAAKDWSTEQLQSVLLHELAHINRRDVLGQFLAQFACALYWFNPLVWLAAWRMHVERELACDDLVLASGVRASVYAEHLLNVATRLSASKRTQACGLAMARSSSLHGRLTAVLSENTNRRRVTKTIALIALLVGCVVAVPIAMLQAANSQPDDKPGNAAKNEEAAGDRHEPFQKIPGTDVLKLTWDDIDLQKILGVESLPEDVKQALPGWLTALEGKKIRIRGVMYPTWEATGLTEFALDRHARFMNFARMTPLDQIIRVRLAAGTTTDYIEARFFDVEGTFRIEPKVEGNDLTELYRIESARIVLRPAAAKVIRGRLLKPNNTPAVGYAISSNDGVKRFEIVTKSPGYMLPAEPSQKAMAITTKNLNSATRGGEYDLGNGRILRIDTRNETKQSFTVIWRETSESSSYRLKVVPKQEEGTSGDIARMRMTPKVPVPAGVGRPTIGWSIVWKPGSSILWLAESGLLSRLEIADPEQVVWTKYDRSGSYSSPEIPDEIRQRFHSFDVYQSILRGSIWPRNIEDQKEPATMQTLTATKVTR